MKESTEQKLKPEELRIGNWVISPGGGTFIDNKHFPEGSFRINGNGVKQFNEGRLSFSPIQITPNILLSFAFEEKHLYEDIYEYSMGNFRLQTNLTDIFIVTGYHDGVEIQFVHQLQNLYFALTSSELTLKG